MCQIRSGGKEDLYLPDMERIQAATGPLRQEGFELGWKKFTALKNREQKLLIGKQQQHQKWKN